MSLTLHKTCEGLRTGGGNGQSQFVHRHAVRHCQAVDPPEGNFSRQQLPQQDAVTASFRRRETKPPTQALNKTPSREILHILVASILLLFLLFIINSNIFGVCQLARWKNTTNKNLEALNLEIEKRDALRQFYSRCNASDSCPADKSRPLLGSVLASSAHLQMSLPLENVDERMTSGDIQA